jgi:hypothetical protein
MVLIPYREYVLTVIKSRKQTSRGLCGVAVVRTNEPNGRNHATAD